MNRSSFASLSAVLLALLLAVPATAGTQDESFYVQRETWVDSMLASRARVRAADERLEVELGPWWATAPLPAKEFSLACFPEEGVDLEAVDEAGEPRWTRRPEWTDGVVHGLPLADHASTYLFRTITATTGAALTASLGSDDGLELWLNDEELYSRDVPRGVAPDQDQVVLRLVAGENRLLFKIHNGAGGHGFYFALRESPLVPLWGDLAADFPVEASWLRRDLPENAHLAWFEEDEGAEISRKLIAGILAELGSREGALVEEAERLERAADGADDPAWLALYLKCCGVRESLEELDGFDLPALGRAVEDLSASFPDSYAPGRELLDEVDGLARRLPGLRRDLIDGAEAARSEAMRAVAELDALRREALLANPLLDFDLLLAVKRKGDSPSLGLPQNWQGNCSLPRKGFDDEIVTLSWREGAGSIETFFAPETPRMVADVDLHYDADRMLFSMLGSHDRWQIWELVVDGAGGADVTRGAGLRQVTPGTHDDIDNYDACYLPNGRIVFDSTRVFQGIPCVGGADQVANLFTMDADGGGMRQLCFDQDHDWCPTVLNNGRVMYTRWEYSDTPHYFSRLLFHMNPDGTSQMEYYGSNSFWPNSIFYARPIPDHPTQVIGIVSGHHGVPRMGELVLFDPAKGRFEADGVVQRIPGWGEEVEPIIVDQLVNSSWPRFLHPWPLSDRYFLVSCKPTASDPWGIWLVDVFDNRVLLAELPGHALIEPIPFRPRPTPPVVPDRVQPDRSDAIVYLADVHAGPGLAGVPRGEVEALRVFEFHYAYPKMGGHKHVAVEGAWDVRRILGTVPVEEDGSAAFRVPANTPLAVQPLDEKGMALQVMRSWFTAMPGEVLSCVGCHENQNTSPPVRATLAARRAPSEIEPWYGPQRGFSFKREVQPVLDRRCVACHDGSTGEDGSPMIDLRRKAENGWGNFTPSYLALHPWVRRPGPESDYHLQEPLEYHASTSELVQMLEKGHHGVELDDEEWDRLVTWIDLNVPDHGTWGEHRSIAADYRERRRQSLAECAGRPLDSEELPGPSLEELAPIAAVLPEPPPPRPPGDTECAGWPFDAEEAARRQRSADRPRELVLDLGDGTMMELVLVPAGEFLMGDAAGYPDELPRTRTPIDEPFYLGRLEVTCAQYARFDPEHDNGYHDQHHKDHTTPGYPASGADRPAIRVSWDEAMAFCAWLSEKSGRTCTLPDEAQWEWACRSGADTAFAFGGLDDDFSPFANLADLSIRLLAVTGVNPQPIPNPNEYEDFLPKDARFDDGERLMARAGQYRPNAWGLHDMHGNVGEWTRSRLAPYPWRGDDGRNEVSEQSGARVERVVRGGSWSVRPKLARSAHRLAYRPYQGVHDVGFRVLVVADGVEVAGR